MSDAPRDRPPLDYARRDAASWPTRVLRLTIDALSIAPAIAVPIWAYLVTRRLADSAARHASLPVADVGLIVLTFAIPIAFALLACGPMARDDRPRGR